jgi:enoyl-CoA hydratase/carnithine racemase
VSYETILYEIDRQVLTITLNRPDRLNAFNAELIHAFDHADADDAVRAIIVTGAGRGFCAGADLAEGAKRFDYSDRAGAIDADGSVDWSNEAVRDSGGLLTLRIFACLKPVIAAVNGAAVGVGATMQLPSSPGADWCRRRVPVGSCPASSASPAPWSGSPPAAYSARPRR